MSAVVLDVRANGNTGVARYGRRVLIASRARLEALDRPVYAVVRERDRPVFDAAFAGSPVRIVTPPEEDRRYLHHSAWLRGLVADVRPSLFYSTNYTMDEHCAAPFVVTIHDLIRLTSPGAGSDREFVARYGPDEYERLRRYATPGRDGGVFAAYLENLTRALAAKATTVATVSAATAADITSVLGVPEHRISIVPSAVEDTFRPRPGAEVERLRDRLGIDAAYVMYVGLAGVHKRVGWLVEQFLAAAPRGCRFVIVGGHGREYDAVRAAARDERIVFTGWLSDDDLAALYTGAAACLSGSVKEGFDLPPAEALACGSHAVVTDIPAHREVLGGHAHYAAPDDAGRFRELLVAALDGRLPDVRPGFRPPTWERASREFVRTIDEAVRPA